MLIVDDFSVCPWPGERSIVTIGAYDGLHVGHRTIIDKVVERARREGSKSVLVTFDRHPASLVRPDSAPKLLTDHQQKLELLRDTGLDALAVVRFDAEQAAESPEDFVARVLVRCLGVAHIIVGSDFHFGRGRAGNVEMLTTLGGHDPGFTVEPVTLIAGHTGVTASSTEIRRLLAAGNVADANVMLGRPFEVRGVVAHGDARGRTIGFPTANVEVLASMCVPGDGVYAAWYVRPGHDVPMPA
ncbi:MAG: bifunctional riboflavin kinase/FAD synthetase, partial [Actinobacteria bacterium]|nr:bifunctional riboflavin kinase/FAD synthetase [Actinomycetota bacterium]